MLDILRQELSELGTFDAPDHPFINSLTKAISFSNVPEKMKVIFAISHLSNFASQFRRNIQLWDGTLVPTNNISFVIAPSGANKDSSNSKVKKCFTDGIQLIHNEVEKYVIDKAIYDASCAGEDIPEEPSIYSKYLKPIPPVFTSMTTGPGLVQHINDIGALPALATSVYSGELSDELASNPHASDNLKILAECYTPDMEVLTEKGFVLFPDLTPDMKVAQWDKDTREVSFEYPTAYINKPYSGNVLTFKTANGYDFTVTENHELVYADWSKKVINTSKYFDIKGTSSKNFIISGYSSGSDVELTPTEKLFIAYQADGSHLRGPLVRGEFSGQYTIEFGFSKERKYKHLMSIIEEGGFGYSLLASAHLNYNLTVYLRDKPSKLLREVFDHTNFSLSKAKQFIEEVAHWDGSVDKQSYITYVTTVQDNADFIQEVALMAGYKTKKTAVEDNRSDKFSTIYRVGINTNSDGFARFPMTEGKGTSQSMKELTHYEGNVHCVSMPKGTVIVRRNGLVNFNGNCFDLGNKEVTYTKGAEFRSDEISGQPVSALFAGSPGYILYDESTRKKFHVTFMSKMARRSWFCYEPEDVKEPDFSTADNPITAMLDYEAAIEKQADEAINEVSVEVEQITLDNIKKLSIPVPVDEAIFDIFTVYKRYNKEVIADKGVQDTVYSLVRAHLQWKALKLAGALAVIEGTSKVTVKQYITAIQYAEMFDGDITEFERDINKAPHEYLSDYLQKSTGADNKNFINIHEIKKRGFSTSISASKLQEVVHLCAGYDVNGVYAVAENASGITYEQIRKTDILGISYLPIDNTRLNNAIDNNAPSAEITRIKNATAAASNQGYSYYETAFDELGLLLQGDYAYSPFNFRDGVRGKDNIIGGTKWLVIDVDKTTLDYNDAHFLLEGINHHVALTSDKHNTFKYRVLIELDSYVELSAIAWKHFFTKIADDLNLSADVLPQSQLFFSYSGRPVLSCTDGTPMECRDYVMYAKEKETEGGIVESIKKIPQNQRNSMLNDPLTTFWYAFDAEKGRRSVTLYRAVRHALDLEADLDYTLDLLEQINAYMSESLDEERFVKLKEQVIRLYGG